MLEEATEMEKETDAMAISHTAAKFNDLWKAKKSINQRTDVHLPSTAELV